MVLRGAGDDLWECPDCGAIVKGPERDFRTIGQLWADEQRVKAMQAKPGGGQRKGRKRRNVKSGSATFVADDPGFNERHLKRLLAEERRKAEMAASVDTSKVPPEFIFPRGYLQYGMNEVRALRVEIPQKQRDNKRAR